MATNHRLIRVTAADYVSLHENGIARADEDSA